MADLPLNQIILGDCVEVMKAFPDSSIDCVVTDPPYGISFMGKEWDKALPDKEAFKQMFRVLKAGGLAFVMSSPRQDVLWRMLQMLEECGFVLKQSFVSWIYKTGFPKAYDLSLGIDKKILREEFVCEHGRNPTKEELKDLLSKKRSVVETKKQKGAKFKMAKDCQREGYGFNDDTRQEFDITEPASDLAKKWNGWKSTTGLKPALECILMVNKPFSEKTIVDNVLKHGTGAVNVDACRIPFQSSKDVEQRKKNDMSSRPNKGKNYGRMGRGYDSGHGAPQPTFRNEGRFPANLLVSDKALDKSRYFDLDAWAEHHGFLDVPKASKSEKEEGMENTPLKTMTRHNIHPTVKPIKLMAYLIELGCQPDGVVLDPFVGSGTTCIAAKQLGRKWIGIDNKLEYVKIAKARLGIKVEEVIKTPASLDYYFGE